MGLGPFGLRSVGLAIQWGWHCAAPLFTVPWLRHAEVAAEGGHAYEVAHTGEGCGGHPREGGHASQGHAKEEPKPEEGHAQEEPGEADTQEDTCQEPSQEPQSLRARSRAGGTPTHNGVPQHHPGQRAASPKP